MSQFMDFFNKELNSAKSLEIDIVNFGKMNVIDNLKKLQRAGKKVRIEKLNCEPIKVRTIYDHVNSMAKTADYMLDKHIIKCNEKKLASMIVYHDLCEVLITDYPRHTQDYKVKSNSIMNVFNVDKKVREEYATNFLWLFADKHQKKSIELLKNDCIEQKYLWLLDKIDPIINTWRYIYVYRTQLNKIEQDYIEIMDDFFTNPALNKIIEMEDYDYVAEALKFLRNPNNARNYLNRGTFNSKNILNKKDKEMIEELIEKVDLFYK